MFYFKYFFEVLSFAIHRQGFLKNHICIYLVCVHVCICVGQRTTGEIGSLLPPYESWGLNSV